MYLFICYLYTFGPVAYCMSIKYIILYKITKEAFPTVPVIAYRQPPNLRKTLVRSKLHTPINTPTPGQCQPCTQCNQCKFMVIQDHDTIINNITGDSYKITGQLSCSTRNVIYTIKCTKCQLLYVGETKREIRKRIYEHLYSIRSNKPTLVAQHFNSPGHNINHFTFIGICKVYSKQDKIRKSLELKIISKLNTLHPYGINKKDW